MEWLVFLGLAGLVYYSTRTQKGASAQELAPAALDATFYSRLEKALANPDVRKSIGEESVEITKAAAIEAWQSNDPQTLISFALDARAAAFGVGETDVSMTPQMTIDASLLSESYRDKIQLLTGQGGVVDGLFADIKRAAETKDPNILPQVGEKASSIDFAAKNPIFGVLKSDVIHAVIPMPGEIPGSGITASVYEVDLLTKTETGGVHLGTGKVAVLRMADIVTGPKGPSRVLVSAIQSTQFKDDPKVKALLPSLAQKYTVDQHIFVFAPASFTKGDA